MRKKIIKHLFATLAVIPVLYILLIFLFWKSFNPETPFKKNIQDYSYEQLSASASGFEVSNNKFKALGTDPWITLEFDKPFSIKKIVIDVKNLSKEDNSAQIYYGAQREISGNQYLPFSLVKGNNTIDTTSIGEVGILRFDLTSIEGNEIELSHIMLVTENPYVVEFWISFITLLLLVGIILNYKVALSILKTSYRGKILIEDMSQLFALSLSDFKSRFSGSYLGIFWGIIQPLSTVLLFWFVFQVGFKSAPIENVPFILWLVAGMIPWNFFYDAWMGGTNSFTNYSYLVKKVVFDIDILPLVRVLASFLLNIIFNIIVIIIYLLYDYNPGFHVIDMAYYSICLFGYALSLSYISATLNVFIKDISQFLGIVLQFMMWMTPMMWSYTMIPEKYSWFYKLNPLHYIINGYRESLIDGIWFFEKPKGMLFFWLLTCVLFISGKYLMNKLKPHFADVL